MKPSADAVWISDDNGGWWCTSGLELLAYILAVCAYSKHFADHGACRCGCKHQVCAYCVNECWHSAWPTAAELATLERAAADPDVMQRRIISAADGQREETDAEFRARIHAHHDRIN